MQSSGVYQFAFGSQLKIGSGPIGIALKFAGYVRALYAGNGARDRIPFAFIFVVEPGSHRLCSDVQSIFAHNLSAATDLAAEPGQTYYFRVTVKDEPHEKPQLRLKAIDDAEGLLLASKFAHSTSQAKK